MVLQSPAIRIRNFFQSPRKRGCRGQAIIDAQNRNFERFSPIPQIALVGLGRLSHETATVAMYQKARTSRFRFIFRFVHHVFVDKMAYESNLNGFFTCNYGFFLKKITQMK